MSTYTQNYSLHQWEDTDDFLRTDFNSDFQKIDTGLASLKTNIATNGYNIYNLMLQNYYEGKYTGYKKALLFDGFMEEDENRTLSDGLVIWNNRLCLFEEGESSYTFAATTTAWSSASYGLDTSLLTVEGIGLLTGFTYKVKSGSAAACTVYCKVNGVTVETASVYYANAVSGALTFTLSTPIVVCAGDTIQFFNSVGGAIYFYVTSSGYLAGTVNITPYEGSTGTMTAETTVDVSWSEAHLWVRYSGGTLTPALNETAMTAVSSAQAQSLSGESCNECCFTLAEGGDTSLELTLALSVGSDGQIIVYDYGLILL